MEHIGIDLCNAFIQGSLNEKAALLAFQTRSGVDGTPLDYVPATPDADPGYHTGLAIIDFLTYLDF